MLTALLLAAAPLSVYVETVHTEKQHEAEAHLWTEALAAELRRWGLDVVTQDDLTAAANSTAQQQKLGCQDKDCGLENPFLSKDIQVIARAVGEDGYRCSIKVIRLKPLSTWADASSNEAYGEAIEGLRELVPVVIEKMRAKAEPGQLAEKPTSNASEPKGADVKKTCSAAGAAPALLAASLWLRRRRRRA